MAIAWLEKKRARWGWVYLAVALLVGVVFLYLPTPVGKISGFVLPNAEWVVSIPDTPRAWERIENSDTYHRISDDAPEIRPKIDLVVRRATGIRWTTARFDRWFNRTVVVSGMGDQYVACIQMRLLGNLAFDVLREKGESGHISIGRMHAESFGGFLFVGSSSEVVALLREGLHGAGNLPDEDVTFEFSDNQVSSVGFRFGSEIESTVSLRNQESLKHESTGHFLIGWPEGPIVSVATRDFSLVEPMFPENLPEFPGSEAFNGIWNEFEIMLPPEWREGTDTIQLALFDVDTSETIPIPDAAVYARSETPLAPLMPPVNAIPYEWSGATGWMTPWRGEGANLFVVANERARVFANEEATMAKIMARERAGSVSSQDAVIDVDAPRLADVLIDLAREAAANELWPEMNADDVEREVVPWIRAFGALGEIRLEGKYENGPLVLRGGTRAPEEAAEPPRSAE